MEKGKPNDDKRKEKMKAANSDSHIVRNTRTHNNKPKKKKTDKKKPGKETNKRRKQEGVEGREKREGVWVRGRESEL